MEPTLDTHAPTSTRRVPRQARSRARVQAILDAADRLLVEDGSAALSARRIAEEAGVSVPSFYQYFADKEGVIDALASRYVDELAGLMRGFAELATKERFDDLAGTVIDAYVALYRARPGQRALWLGPRVSDEVRRADRAKKRTEVDALARVFVAQGLAEDGERLERICRAAILAGDALLGEAFLSDSQGDPGLIEEAKRMLRGYVDDVRERYATA